MEIERKDYPGLPQPAGAFHHSVRVGNLLFIAGSTARGTAAETGDIAAQTEAILEKFKTILEANGGSLASVVKVTSFVTDLREAAASGEVRRKYFDGGISGQHPGTGCGIGHTGFKNRDRSHRCVARLAPGPQNYGGPASLVCHSFAGYT